MQSDDCLAKLATARRKIYLHNKNNEKVTLQYREIHIPFYSLMIIYVYCVYGILHLTQYSYSTIPTIPGSVQILHAEDRCELSLYWRPLQFGLIIHNEPLHAKNTAKVTLILHSTNHTKQRPIFITEHFHLNIYLTQSYT